MAMEYLKSFMLVHDTSIQGSNQWHVFALPPYSRDNQYDDAGETCISILSPLIFIPTETMLIFAKCI